MTLMDGARTTMRVCLGVKRGERVLVLTDNTRQNIADALYKAAVDLGADAMMMIILPSSRHGKEPAEPVANLMRSMDVIVAPTEFSLSHTQARKKANDAGTRIATMPTITEEMMGKGGMTADFKEVRKAVGKAHRKALKFKEVDVRTKLGTALHLKFGRRKWIEDTGLLHRRGDFGNLPAGELFIAPMEGKTNGTLVVDGSFGGIGKLDRPIRIKIEDGIAEKITGGKSAKKLRDILKKHEKLLDDPRLAYNIAEFGIGLNPKAKIIGNPLEDEKAIGTIHVALGDNSTFGGKVRAGIHMDGIVNSPNVGTDERMLIVDGVVK